MGYGQPRVIVYINFVYIESLMPNVKFQMHQNFNSEEFFLLHVIGMTAAPFPHGTPQNMALVGLAVSEKKIFENNGHI